MSDITYKKIISNSTNKKILNESKIVFNQLSQAINKFEETPHNERMLIKSLLIEKMAEAEINLKFIKIILDMNSSIGTGILTSMKRKKIMERLGNEN